MKSNIVNKICNNCKHPVINKCSYCCTGASKLCDDMCCTFCFDASFMSNDKSAYLTDDVHPRFIRKGSKKKYNFYCGKCTHVFEQSICEIVSRNGWCPYCSYPVKKLCNNDSCDHCYNNSFASCEKSKYLIDNVDPRYIFWGSGKKYNFECNECFHIFEKSIGEITRKTFRKTNWCPFCSNPPKKLCDNNCKLCFDKSFASHPKSKFLIDDIDPRKIFRSSNLYLNFKCENCNHKYNTNLATATTQNIWCYYCSSVDLCDDEKCLMCFNKSFASVEISKYIQGDINTRKLHKGLRDIYNFKCKDCNNIYSKGLCYMTLGTGCPYCKNKTEKMFNNFLKDYHPSLKIQAKYDWCKDKDFLRFDYVIEKYKLLIELDGNQHFIQIMNWKSPEDNLKTDVFKMKKAIENGYSVIRIRQIDFYKNLLDHKKILELIKQYDKPTVICLAIDQHIYDNHMKYLSNIDTNTINTT